MFKLKSLHVAILFRRIQPGNRLNVEIKLKTDEKSIEIDPYCCSIKAMVGRPQQLKTVGHILREISRHVSFFLKEKNGQTDGNVHSVNYQLFPIPAGGLEIPLIFNFKSPCDITHTIKKEFVNSLHSFDYVANKTEPSSSDEEEVNLLMQESSESNSDVAKPKRKKKYPTVNEMSALVSDSEVDKEKENLLKDDYYDIVIEK